MILETESHKMFLEGDAITTLLYHIYMSDKIRAPSYEGQFKARDYGKIK